MSDYWDHDFARKRAQRRTKRAAEVLGIDIERFRGKRVPGTTIDALDHEIHRVARLRTPCKCCGSTGPRVQESEWCDMLLCDGCRSLDRKQEQAQNQDFLRSQGFGRTRRLGRYMPDGHGCVTRTTIADRVTLGGESPYG